MNLAWNSILENTLNYHKSQDISKNKLKKGNDLLPSAPDPVTLTTHYHMQKYYNFLYLMVSMLTTAIPF